MFLNPSFPFPHTRSTRFFMFFFSSSYCHCKKLVHLLEVKLTEVTPTSESPWSFYVSGLSLLSLQQFFNYSLGFPTLGLVPVKVSALVSWDSLYPPVYLSSFWGSDVPCDLTSLTCYQEWQLLSSLDAGPETRSPVEFIITCWSHTRPLGLCV